MSVRLRRLKADYDMMCTIFTSKTRIRILKTLGTPPEKYQIEFLVPSLQQNLSTQHIGIHNSFIAEITLTGSYPRLPPQCRMLTPVFHPNIAPHAICIGDHWAAGESLSNLVVRIGEMLAFQSYNLKSPLNGEAARWAEKNKDKLPLDTFDFSSLLSIGEAVGRSEDGALISGAECANCGKKAAQGAFAVCVNRHSTCRTCQLECPVCKGVICLKCDLTLCAICKESACHNCVLECASCKRKVCLNHAGKCAVCGRSQCSDCLAECEECGQSTCLEHIVKISSEGVKRYLCSTCSARFNTTADNEEN